MDDQGFEDPIEQGVLDKLADGELSDHEVRRVVASFDGEIDAWRRCALAFIERQMWQRDLMGIARPSAVPDEVAAVAVKTSKPRRTTARWHLPLAMAASMLLAFVAARGYENWLSVQPNEKPTSLAKKGDHPKSRKDGLDIHEVSDTPAGRLTLSMDTGNSLEQNVEIPFYEEGQIDKKRLAQLQKNPIPADVVRQLREAGHTLVRKQQVLHVDLENGKRVIIPVEQVEIVPVNRPIQ